MKLVVDTNVLVSAFLWQGTPGRLIELAGEKECRLFTSRALHDELAEVLQRKKLAKQVQATGLTAAQILRNYRNFAQACEDNDDVLFYIKLPRWFQIETPVGSYNPDWALAYRNDKTLYFVAETKKTGNGDHVRLDLLRPIEELRIECGKRHFKNFEEVQFKVVSSLTELVG
jgi:type III restriction enzyme